MDTATGASSTRPELTRCLQFLRAMDTLVVWKLDRLGLSLSQLSCHGVGRTTRAGALSVADRSHIGTESVTGRLLGHILGALAEFERVLIVEHTQAGLKAAKKLGVKLGRKPSFSDIKHKHLRILIKGESQAAVAKLLNECRATHYNSFKD